MHGISRLRPRSLYRLGRHRRATPLRPAFERLEDRTMLDTAFASVADEVEKRLGALELLLGGAATATASLPVINATLGSVADDAASALQAFRTEFKAVVSSLDSTLPDELLEQQLYDKLNPLGVLNDTDDDGSTRDEVHVTHDVDGKLRVRVNVSKEQEALGSFTFGLGLPGVPLRIDRGAVEVTAGFAYDNLSFGLAPGGSVFFDTTTHQDEFQVTVSATLDSDTKITGTLGFMAVTAKEKGGTGLEASLFMDVRGDDAKSMSLHPGKIEGSAEVNIDITADFAAAKLIRDSQYPSITTNLFMHWDLNDSDSKADGKDLGDAPIVEFRNVTFGLGTFLSNVLRPVVGTIRDFMRPMDPILKIITTEIPLLSHISKEANQGPITLKELAKVLGEAGALPPDYQLLFDLSVAATDLHELLIDVDTRDPNLKFNVGSFQVSGEELHKHLSPDFFNRENLTTLIPIAIGELQSINQQLSQSTPDELKPIFNLIDQKLRSAQNDAGFNFPLLDDPLTGVFKLLLGQDVDFVNYTAEFHFDAYKTELLPIPLSLPFIPPFVKLRLNGQIDVDAYFKVGYDTYGLRKFLQRLQVDGVVDPGQLAKGLYFDASEPLLKLNGSISAGAAFEILPVPFVPVPVGPFVAIPVPANVSFNGQLSAEDVIVSFGSNSSEFRLLEALPQPLFNTQGLIKAGFTFVVEAGIPGVAAVELYKRVLDETVLFDLYNGELANPGNPFVPPPGEEAPVGLIVDLNRPSWGGSVFVGSPGNDGSADTIEVFVSGGDVRAVVNGVDHINPNQWKVTKVSSITVIGSDDEDFLTVHGNVNKPMIFEGGDGPNGLTIDDRGVGGANTRALYRVAGFAKGDSEFSRRMFSTSTGLPLAGLSVRFTGANNVTLYATSNTNLVQATVDQLYNQELNLILGQTTNSITVDTTNGGFADTVNISHLVAPFLPPPQTSLLVRDRNIVGDDALLYGKGRYEVTRNQLTRTKRLPPTFTSSGPIPIISISGKTTINYDGVNELSIKGGDLGNDFDVQNTDPDTRYRFTGGLGTDTFIIGQTHHNLPLSDGTLVERRQLGFVDTDITIDGVEGITDRVVLDDSGSDLLPYVPRNVYLVGKDSVDLFSSVDTDQGPVSTQGTYDYANIESLTIKGGGLNEFIVFDTMTKSEGFFEIAKTTIVGGAHADTIAVLGTTGPLELDAGGGVNQIFVGAPGAFGNLDSIRGSIALTGQAPGVINDVVINDTANNQSNTYLMESWRFKRTGADATANVFFAGMAIRSLDVKGGNGGNVFTIDGTPVPDPTFGTQIDIYTGDNDDFVTVRGTSGPVSLNLGLGVYQTVSFGDDDTSLDAIQGDFTVSGGGFIDAFISNELDMVSRYISIDDDFFSGQFLERYTVDGEQVYYSNRFLFPVAGELRLQYTGGQGGDTVFIAAVPANASVLAYGSPGVRDTFALGFAGDTNRILGPVYIHGQAEDGDFAYYYEFLNPNPQTYTVSTDSFSAALVVQRPAVADVRYHGLQQVVFYAPFVGGNTVSVQGVPAGTILNMAVGGGDAVTLGAPTAPTCLCVDAPLPERTLAGILGPVQVGAYANPDGTLAAVSLTIDDSGNTDPTPRRAELSVSPVPLNYYEALTGLAPAAIYWNLGPSSSVAIRGGAADETFVLLSTAFVTPISIDGGGGINTLDYADADTTGLVSWYKADGNANDAVGSMHGVAKNGAAFDTGHLGQAFNFDGVDDFIEIADSPHHTPISITLDAWVKPDTVAGAHFIVTKYDSSEPNNKSWALGVIDGRVRFGVYQGNAARAIDTDMPVLTEGVWQHVAGIFDVATQTIKIYVNGEEIPSSFVPGGHDSTLTAITDSSSPVRIGSIVNVNGEMVFFWDGLIDDVGIFNRALTAAEVQARFLDDAQFPVGTGVYVNLPTGEASGLAGGIDNFHNIVGSGGDDILVGNGGNILDGRGGRDLLIAGNAASVLLGGGGEDLLIAGTTDYDLDPAALGAIHDEWRRTDIDYDARVANLTTHNGAPVPKLTTDTVASNGGGNLLSGDDVASDDNALDLFFASFDLDFYDSEEGEWLFAI